MERRRSGEAPDKTIKVLFVMRSDMQGHWYMFDQGGMRDVQKMFCMCCTELLTDHKAGKMYTIVKVDETETMITLCEKFRIKPVGVAKANKLIKNAPDGSSVLKDVNHEDFLEAMGTENQEILEECLSNPTKVIPLGTLIPMLRIKQINRQNAHGMNPKYNIHCGLHTNGRIVNTLIGNLQEIATQLRQLTFINEELKSHGVSVQFNEKSANRNLNGEQCTG
mmetsp:Transcript_4273/g.10354  ORF Transcript_4273/g.10354 Transcript_4273/m.10354 type:complete len:222 (-) Transcript_4273:604-1269(-)